MKDTSCFLNAIMYPHKEDFMETISEYIDFSENEELWEEEKRVNGLGQSILREGFEKGIEQGIVQGTIETYQSVGISKGETVSRVQQRFSVSQEDARSYVEQYWV